MATPGRFNTLRISKILDFGVYLDGEQLGEILLPMKWVPDHCRPDDPIDVFIYFDSEDRLIATTQKPYAQAGEFVLLKAKAVNETGAFMDWGLDKDLLVPYREQKAKMVEGRSYLIYVYPDPKSGRLAGSARLERFLDKDTSVLQPGEAADLIIWLKTDLGYKAIINHRYEGLLYENEIFTPLKAGQKMKGYIRKIREDGKADLSLQKPGFEKIDALSERLIELLKQSHGHLGLNDKSSTDEIYLMLGVSKKTFKKAIGGLYKKRMIRLDDDGIYLVNSMNQD